MRTQAGDTHTLPLLHPVLDPIQLHNRSALNTICHHMATHCLMSAPGGRNRTSGGRGCDKAPAAQAAERQGRSRRDLYQRSSSRQPFNNNINNNTNIIIIIPPCASTRPCRPCPRCPSWPSPWPRRRQRAPPPSRGTGLDFPGPGP